MNDLLAVTNGTEENHGAQVYHEVGKGAKIRFDRFSGSRLDWERKKAEATGVFLNFGKRFCEHCNSLKPKGKRKAVKGWKCDDCMTANP